MIHGLNKIDDIRHGPVRHGRCDVARYRVRQRGTDIGLGKLLLPGPLSAQNIAVALHQNLPISQHIRQLSHLLGVSNGLVERICEIVGTQNRKVGILRFQVLIGMAVYHRQIIIVVFLADKTARILAEGADFILKGQRITDKLRLIENIVYILHDLVSHFHAHADIHGPRHMGDIMLLTELFQPVCSFSAGGHDHMIGINHLFIRMLCGIFQYSPFTDIVLHNQIPAVAAKQNLHALFQQILLNPVINLLGLFCSQMADRAVYQLQAGLNGSLPDIFYLLFLSNAFHLCIRAKFQIDLIRILNHFLGKVLSNQGWQISAHFIA